MAIHFACACGQGFSVRQRRAGKIGTCPKCGQAVRVPNLVAPAQSAPGTAVASRAMAAVRALAHYGFWPVAVGASLWGSGWALRNGYGFQVAVLGVYAVLNAALLVLERLFPYRRAWHGSDGQIPHNVAHTVLAAFVAPHFAGVFLITAALPYAHRLAERFGGTLWPQDWPMGAQLLLMLVGWDFVAYWTHRWSHEWRWLWRVHALHHSPAQLNVINAGRFHAFDAFKTEFIAVPLSLLAGMPVAVLIWYVMFFRFIGLLSHANIDLRFGPLNYIFNTPVLHRWHHSVRPEEGLKNYGQNLMLWDLLFGTYYNPPDRAPGTLGIRDPMPRGFVGQMLSPFTLGGRRARAAQQRAETPAAARA